MQRLDITAPVMTGCDTAARSLLAAAEAPRSQADAEDWPQVERAFLQAIRQMEQARDPLVADAWAGLARSVRYQKGRRDDRITATVTSLYWDRSNKIAWAELVDLASAAPHVPTLLGLFRRVPADARPPVLTKLISLVPWPRPAGEHAPRRWRPSPRRASHHGGDRGRQANNQGAIR